MISARWNDLVPCHLIWLVAGMTLFADTQASAAVVLDISDTGAAPIVLGISGGTGTLADPFTAPAGTVLTFQIWFRQSEPPTGAGAGDHVDFATVNMTNYGVMASLSGGTSTLPATNTSTTFFANAAPFTADGFITNTGTTPPITSGFGANSTAIIGHGADFFGGSTVNANGGIRLGDVMVTVGTTGVSMLTLADSPDSLDDWGFNLTGMGDEILGTRTLHIEPTAVPEPSSFLCLTMIIGAFLCRTRFKQWLQGYDAP